MGDRSTRYFGSALSQFCIASQHRIRMKLLIILACAFACMALDQEWEDYKLEFDKRYTAEEEESKYQTWKKAVAEINLHNAQYDRTFEQGINQFTDMTDEEFAAEYLSGYEPRPENDEDATTWVPSNEPIPNSVDWRSQGMVTEVKNQGACGSCYSFSATGALEGQWKKKTGSLISMSEQQIVDCSGRWGNHGCHGGRFQSSWNYIKSAGGIVSENSYPYHPSQGRCYKRGSNVATVRGVVQIPHNSEAALTQALAQVGPISVAIDASPSSFRRYRSGVHYSSNCHHPNHAVLAVGYGTENGQDYYLVKNSWGTRYGMGGYVKMARNRNNNCCIAMDTAYPTV